MYKPTKTQMTQIATLTYMVVLRYAKLLIKPHTMKSTQLMVK